MSKSIYIEMGLFLLLALIIKGNIFVYLVLLLVLVYFLIKVKLEKRELTNLLSSWKNYFVKGKREELLSSKSKLVFDFVEGIKEKELKKSRELFVASERLEALRNQVESVVDKTEKNLDGFIERIETGLEINRFIEGDMNGFAESFEELVEINDLSMKELEGVLEENKSRKNMVDENINLIDIALVQVASLNKRVTELEKHGPKLEESLIEVGKIVGVVEKVVKKTELLSINASIEATRAGEVGKGFGVVAGEIIGLANESRRAIGEIEKNIGFLSRELEEIIGGIRESKVEVVKVEESSGTIKESINKLQGEFGSLSSDLGRIGENSLKERGIFKEIEGDLSRINQEIDSSREVFDRVEEATVKQKRDLKLLIGVTSDLDKATEGIKELTSDIEDIIGQGGEVLEKIVEEEREKLKEFVGEKVLDNYSNLDKYLNSRVRVEAIWLTDTEGNFVHSIPEAGINNGRGRSWFIEGMKDGSFESEVYISAINKKPCITLSKSILNREGNRVEGLIGIDLEVEA